MRKNTTKKKEAIPIPNSCKSTRGVNKKISHNMNISSRAFPPKNNNPQINSKQNIINNFPNNKNIVCDQEFISYINKLSDIIKDLHKENNTNFSSIKNILEKSNNNIKNNSNNNNQNKNNKIEKKNNNNNFDDNLNSINNSFNNIESNFNNFYNNAIILFKKMKAYKETAENKNALLNINNNNNRKGNNKEENKKSRGNSFYKSPKKLLDIKKDNLKQIININTKNHMNENVDNSVDKINNKLETDNNDFHKHENYEINVTRRNINNNKKKIFTKTPSKGLISSDNIINNKKEEEIINIIKENNLLKELNTQLENKNKNLLDLIQKNNMNNINNKNGDDINTNLSINDTINIINMNTNKINARNYKDNDLDINLNEKSDILNPISHNNSFLYNSVCSTKNIYSNIKGKNNINYTNKKELNHQHFYCLYYSYYFFVLNLINFYSYFQVGYLILLINYFLL